MTENDIISSGLLELYVLGKTTEQETNQVLEWKAMYASVGDEIAAIEDSLEVLDVAKAIAPSNNLKKDIFAKLNRNENAKIKNSIAVVKPINSNYKYVAAASVALLFGSVLFSFSAYKKYQKANEALAIAERKIAAKNEDVASLEKQLDVPLNNASQSVVLKGTTTAPSSTAKIFWVRNTNEVYVEPSGLPEVPKGFQYQLWAIVDGKPVDAGTIIYDKNKKYNIQKMKSFGKAQAFAITLEKEGGSPTPTMEKMFVMSSI